MLRGQSQITDIVRILASGSLAKLLSEDRRSTPPSIPLRAVTGAARLRVHVMCAVKVSRWITLLWKMCLRISVFHRQWVISSFPSRRWVVMLWGWFVHCHPAAFVHAPAQNPSNQGDQGRVWRTTVTDTMTQKPADGLAGTRLRKREGWICMDLWEMMGWLVTIS
jgi:hypothetical protein